MRLLYLLVWDAMFCIVLSISHFASRHPNLSGFQLYCHPDYLCRLRCISRTSDSRRRINHCFCHASGAVSGARAISRTNFKYAAPPAAGRHFSGAAARCVPDPCCCAMPAHSQPDTRCGEKFQQ